MQGCHRITHKKILKAYKITSDHVDIDVDVHVYATASALPVADVASIVLRNGTITLYYSSFSLFVGQYSAVLVYAFAYYVRTDTIFRLAFFLQMILNEANL